MNQYLLRTGIFIALLASGQGVVAQVYTATDHSRTQPQNQTQSSPWEAWGLTEGDWQRYETLMQGPRGNWTPTLDPISVLGSHAQTDEERTRLARLASELQLARLKAEKAWSDAFLHEWSRYTNEQIRAQGLDLPTTTKLRDLTVLDELVLIADVACSNKCSRIMTPLISGNFSVDIFFVGNPSRDEITQWAKSMGITPEMVNSHKRITLNLDTQQFAQKLGNNPLPLLFVRDPAHPTTLLEVSL